MLNDKVWNIKNTDIRLPRNKTGNKPPIAEKDPVKALNLSLLCWGGGQIYNGQPAKGATFLMTMVFLIAVVVILFTNYDELIIVLRERGIRLSSAFLAMEAALFLIILFWSVNASDAYHHARRSHKMPFRGVDSKIAPLLGSLVLPGWGQFLNGQQLKASIYAGFSVVGIFSVLSAVLTCLAWPLLDSSDTRDLVESIFAMSLIVVPFVPLLHVVSAFDAFKVSLDDLKKEPRWERIKAAYYRGRTQGFVQGVFPQIKSALLLLLVLTFSAIIVLYWFPREFYTTQITNVKRMLSERGMIIVPELINRLLAWINGATR